MIEMQYNINYTIQMNETENVSGKLLAFNPYARTCSPRSHPVQKNKECINAVNEKSEFFVWVCTVGLDQRYVVTSGRWVGRCVGRYVGRLTGRLAGRLEDRMVGR